MRPLWRINLKLGLNRFFPPVELVLLLLLFPGSLLGDLLFELAQVTVAVVA